MVRQALASLLKRRLEPPEGGDPPHVVVEPPAVSRPEAAEQSPLGLLHRILRLREHLIAVPGQMEPVPLPVAVGREPEYEQQVLQRPRLL
jgi:hypothetical protein